MSQSVNVTFAKCFIIFMATVILVQGVAYIALAIKGIQLHDCDGENSDPKGKPFDFVLNLIYFSSEKCGKPNIVIDGAPPNVDGTLEIAFVKAEVISDREYIFLISYIVISVLWVVTSLFVLVTICCPLTKLVAIICFWPWLISVIVGSVLDAVATGYHIYDITQTTTAAAAFEYVGATPSDEVKNFLKDYDAYFIVPAVAFACISSRVVLIWLLNIIGSIFCLSLAKVLSSNISEKPKQPRRPSSADTALPSEIQAPRQPELQQQESVEVRFHPIDPSPETLRRARSTLEPVKMRSSENSPTEPTAPYALPIIREPSIKKSSRGSGVPKEHENIPVEAPTYQISDAHHENLDYPQSRYSASPSQQRSVTPELSAISPLNLRYSGADGVLFPNQPHVNQELRSQLPWSYTNIMNDPIAQKRIQAHLQPEEDEDFPPIPVPDYTLHPPKKDRPTISQDRVSQSNYSRW